MPRQPLKEKAFLAPRRRCLMAIGLERGKGLRWEVLARKLAQQLLPLRLGRGVALDALVAAEPLPSCHHHNHRHHRIQFVNCS